IDSNHRIVRPVNGLAQSPADNSQNTCVEVAQYINTVTPNYESWAMSNPSAAQDAEKGITEGGGSPGTGQTSCAIEGMGWVLCPIMSGIGIAVDALYQWIESTLVLSPLATMEDGVQTPQYTAWQS